MADHAMIEPARSVVLELPDRTSVKSVEFNERAAGFSSVLEALRKLAVN
jgi:hypothetical protein